MNITPADYGIANEDHKLRKCSHCEDGWRSVIGNCPCCGCGPAPGAVNFHGEPMPQNDQERFIVLWKLFHGIFPETLNGRDYPPAESRNTNLQ